MVKSALRKAGEKKLWRLRPLFILAILPSLLNLILDPGLGKFLFLHHQKKLVQEEVAVKINLGLNREKLVLLEFSPEEARIKLKWRSAREFEFNHELYDVVESVIEDDKILFWCWPDQKESALEKEIEWLISRIFSQKRNSLSKLEESTSCPRIYLFLPAQGLILLSPDSSFNLNMFSLESIYSFELQPPTPPPRRLS